MTLYVVYRIILDYLRILYDIYIICYNIIVYVLYVLYISTTVRYPWIYDVYIVQMDITDSACETLKGAVQNS